MLTIEKARDAVNMIEQELCNDSGYVYVHGFKGMCACYDLKPSEFYEFMNLAQMLVEKHLDSEESNKLVNN